MSYFLWSVGYMLWSLYPTELHESLASQDQLSVVLTNTIFYVECCQTTYSITSTLICVSPHLRHLKVYDMCIILWNLNKKVGLTNKCIWVQTMGTSQKNFSNQRIRFKCRLPFGRSFELQRTKFPLRSCKSTFLIPDHHHFPTDTFTLPCLE